MSTTFGRNLEHLLQRRKWGVGRLALVTGLPKHSLQKAIDNPKTTLWIQTLVRVATGLGCSYEELLSGSERFAHECTPRLQNDEDLIAYFANRHKISQAAVREFLLNADRVFPEKLPVS